MKAMHQASMLALLALLACVASGAALAQHRHGAAATQAPECTPEHAAMGHCVPAGTRAAATACTPEHAAMGHCALPVANASTDHCTPAHAAMGHCTPAQAQDPDAAGAGRAHHPQRNTGHSSRAHEHHATPADCAPAHAAMGHCVPQADAAQVPHQPIAPITDADRAAAFPALANAHMPHGAATYTRVTFNRFEAWDGDDASGQAWEASASTGGDIHRIWLRSSGSRSAGSTDSANAELRWSRAVARWWDVVAGVRHDFNPGPSRTRAALGVQGIAPYMFEVSALAYVGEGGGVAAKLEAEYDMRFSNRLVLQPLLELELHSSDDPARLTGSGLSKAEAGLRLRYEVTRRFAPYLGIAHERSFGRTARYHEDAGEAARDTRLVAGVRFWF